MDMFRPESPETDVLCQPLGPKPSNDPASAFPNFHQEDTNPMRVTHPVRFQCPDQQVSCSFPSNPTAVTFQPCFISVIFFNVGFYPVSSTAFKPGSPLTVLPKELAIASLCPGSIAEPRTTPGCRSSPCSSQAGTALSALGRAAEGKGKVSREAGQVVVTEGETTRLQLNLYPYSKTIQLGDPGGGPLGRARIWVHPQPCSQLPAWILPFYCQIPLPH